MESIVRDHAHMVNDKFYETYNEKIKIIVKKILSQTAMTQDIDDCVNTVYLKLISMPDGFDEKRGSMELVCTILTEKSNGMKAIT